MATTFETIINKFLGKITDDMYLELTPEDTIRDAKQFLFDAIPYFEFQDFRYMIIMRSQRNIMLI